MVNPLLLAGAGWLVPGIGFFLLGRRNWSRGIVYLLIMHLTFAIGLALHGGVVWPVWSFRGEGFSIMNNLIFLAQMGAGWPALLSLAGYFFHVPFIGPTESHAYFEIGSFYCLTVGALNYFVIIQSLERAKRKAFELLVKQ